MHVGALRYLVAVADAGSFGRAARRLHVSQPSVSQAIRKLEHQYGVALLDRSGARIVATPAGEQIIDDIRDALGHLDRARERASGNTSAATLRIGCVNLLAHWLMPHALGGFHAARPDIAVTVSELEIPAQNEALLARTIDMTFGESLLWRSDLDALIVGEHPCAVWMAAAHPLAAHEAIELRMLKGIPLPLGDPDLNPTFGPWLLRQLEDAGVPPTIAPVMSDAASGFRAILAGECVALAPDVLHENAMPGLAVRPVLDPIRFPWTLTRARDRPSAVADAFATWVQSGDADAIIRPAPRR